MSDLGGSSAACSLTEVTGPLTIQRNDGRVLEALHVRSSLVGGAAVQCRDSSNVVLRRLLIEHPEGGVGIRFERCPGLRIEQVEVRVSHADQRYQLDVAEGVAHPARCSIGSNDCHNIHGIDSELVVIERVRVEGGSSGVELQRCARPQVRDIVARNVRGPYPRGQCVQFTVCDHASLVRFHCYNDVARSWPEDSISVWRSHNVTVRAGLVDGNNAPNGVGVMFENDDTRATGGIVEDVDAIHMGDGCFSGYPATSLLMRNTRCGWNHCEGAGGRDQPSSGGQMYAAGDQPHGVQGYVRSRGVRVVNSSYHAPCDTRRKPFWSKSPDAYAATPEIVLRPFVPRAPITVSLCWETPSPLALPPPSAPLPPPRPALPPLGCRSWCSARYGGSHCGNEECKGCAFCTPSMPPSPPVPPPTPPPPSLPEPWPPSPGPPMPSPPPSTPVALLPPPPAPLPSLAALLATSDSSASGSSSGSGSGSSISGRGSGGSGDGSRAEHFESSGAPLAREAGGGGVVEATADAAEVAETVDDAAFTPANATIALVLLVGLCASVGAIFYVGRALGQRLADGDEVVEADEPESLLRARAAAPRAAGRMGAPTAAEPRRAKGGARGAARPGKSCSTGSRPCWGGGPRLDSSAYGYEGVATTPASYYGRRDGQHFV